MRKVDIVIPVYRGLEETRQCLTSALATADPAWARLVVVNDASPEAEVTDLLYQLAAEHVNLVLLENEHNLGFVATANRGMRHDLERDILLLNSDVEVANDWLHRMREAAYAHVRVGSLTPFSNNATIFSFPNFCEDNTLVAGLGVADIDSVFAELFSASDVTEVPTGVGCCMYIRRDCLDDIGYFDQETFGRGYGEENDWCQRAQEAGWHNYHLANCFIYHKGKVSFGEEHDPRVEEALRLVDQKHPGYHAAVQAFIAEDPFRDRRMGALLSLYARQDRPKILCISHKLGGGAQQHVDELAGFYRDRALFLQITPDREGQSVILSLFDAGARLQDGLYFDVDREYQKLVDVLTQLGVGRVHFHHTMGLHPRLWLLSRDLGCGHDLTVHDYFLINGNPTLTDANALHVPEHEDDFDARCATHYPLPPGVDAGQWRENQKLLVEGADRVIFPSQDCAERFQKFFQVANPVVAWHPDYQLSQPYPAPTWRYSPGRSLRVLVLGAISREKGADVLEAVAAALAGEDIEFHLLGYGYRSLAESVITHGPYANSDVYKLVETIAPDVVWYPALWPETYSYTLSIALHMGLPVVVPDIGAFPERVTGRACSVICPWNWSTPDWTAFWRELQRGQTLSTRPADPACRTSRQDQFYDTAYLGVIPVLQREMAAATLAALGDNYRTGRPELSRSERLLGHVWRISRSPLMAKLISLVPFRVQRAIKRRLSSRPMHDIVGGR